MLVLGSKPPNPIDNSLKNLLHLHYIIEAYTSTIAVNWKWKVILNTFMTKNWKLKYQIRKASQEIKPWSINVSAVGFHPGEKFIMTEYLSEFL